MTLFSILPNEILQKNLYHASNKSLVEVSQVDNKFYHIIDENFWKNKLFNDDPIALNLKLNSISFKQYSLDLYHRVKYFPVYFDDKLLGYVLISDSDTLKAICPKIVQIGIPGGFGDTVITVKLSNFPKDRFYVLSLLN